MLLLINHELTWTGAPLILVETARAMQDSGANVRLFTLADDAFYGNMGERYRDTGVADRDSDEEGGERRLGTRKYDGGRSMDPGLPRRISFTRWAVDLVEP